MVPGYTFINGKQIYVSKPSTVSVASGQKSAAILQYLLPLGSPHVQGFIV
jgi:hypothetical protein